jgi:hypothetical protein
MVFLSAILPRLTATQARRHLIRVGASYRECSAKQPSEDAQKPAGALFCPRWVIGGVCCWDGLQTAPGTFYALGRGVPAIDVGRGMSCRQNPVQDGKSQERIAGSQSGQTINLIFAWSSARSQVKLLNTRLSELFCRSSSAFSRRNNLGCRKTSRRQPVLAPD